MLAFSVASDSVTIFEVVIDESGNEIPGQNKILVDGQEHVSESGYALPARWHGPYILETPATQDGLSVGWEKYEVAEGGHVMTISGDEQTIVLDHT